LANLGFGGKLIYGGMDVGAYLPADPDCNLYVHATSEQQALGHDESTHGGRNFLNPFYNQCGDNIREQIIHAVQSLNNGADPNGSSSGYPDFPDWPVWKDLTHQKMWVEWIRRSYAGNLRVMVALAVNNQTLGDAVIGPGDTLPTDDKGSADLQIREIKSFVGRHADFMEVAYSSADVYRIVSANKLAVVIGIEIDNIGNLNKATQPPTNAAISGEIDRLFAEGVRYIFPIHLLDNAFGGTAVYEDLFNFSTFREDGHYWNLRCAPPPSPANSSEAINYKFTSHTVQEITLLDIASTIKLRTTFPLPPTYPQCGQANSAGLTSQGRFALNEMMRHGLLIDVDHMSQAAADETLAIAKEIAYPINSGHNGLRGALPDNHNERALRADQYTAIGTLHGMAGVGSGGLDASTWLTLYNQVMTAMALGGGSVVGAFGTDTNGVAPGMPPRLGYGQKECIADCDCTSDLGAKAKAKCLKTCAAGCRKRFPNVVNGAAEGASAVQYSKAFPASADGNKTWNYNVVGVAHYGMLPDFLQDVKSLPEGATMVEGFMTGADYFYRTWKIAEEKKALVK
jgi:microsomal dipeptidase-like Zn-dependent dipeptidase